MNATVFSTSAAAERVLHQVPVWFEEWESILSRFRKTSELSLYNQSGGRVDEMSEPFRSVLTLADRMERESGGLVSARVLPALERVGYRQSFTEMASGGIGFNHDPSPIENSLDFGGFAKGWAAHQAVRRLSQYAPALVNAGGDIAISGLMPDGKGWIIQVTDPFDPDRNLAEFRVGRGGVATSGIDYRKWEYDGRSQHHIIDPRSGLPAETDLISVTIIAPDVMTAEMAAKSVLILGSEEGQEWLAKRPNLAGFLVKQDQSIIRTPSLVFYNARSL